MLVFRLHVFENLALFLSESVLQFICPKKKKKSTNPEYWLVHYYPAQQIQTIKLKPLSLETILNDTTIFVTHEISYYFMLLI